jgi:hypothetical protein
VGGIVPADKSRAIATACERKRIPRFILDTFWLARPKMLCEMQMRLMRFRLPRSDSHANKEILK